MLCRVTAAAAAAFGASASRGAGAAASAAAAQQAAGAAATATGAADKTYSKQDAVFAKNVGQAVVDWILERLSDYHTR